MNADPLARIERIRNLLALFLVGAFVGALLAFTFKDIPDANKDIITYMVGQLSGMATLALGFYFVNKVGQDALDAAKTENSGKAFEAIAAAAKAGGDGTGAEVAAEEVADAAVEKAEEFKPAKGKK
jgi:hypothetical protein